MFRTFFFLPLILFPLNACKTSGADSETRSADAAVEADPCAARSGQDVFAAQREQRPGDDLSGLQCHDVRRVEAGVDPQGQQWQRREVVCDEFGGTAFFDVTYMIAQRSCRVAKIELVSAD